MGPYTSDVGWERCENRLYDGFPSHPVHLGNSRPVVTRVKPSNFSSISCCRSAVHEAIKPSISIV